MGKIRTSIDMEDTDFLRKIDQGLRFGKGDKLMANVRFTQVTDAHGILRMERSVIEVIKHEIPPTPDLLF